MYALEPRKINPELEPIIARLFAAFPATNVSPLTVLVYVEDLSGYPTEIVGQACQNLRRSYQFQSVPPIGVIIEEVKRLQSALWVKKASEALELKIKQGEVDRQERLNWMREHPEEYQALLAGIRKPAIEKPAVATSAAEAQAVEKMIVDEITWQ